MNNVCISLSKFLSRFANLKGYNLTKMTHEEVAELLPNLERVSFEEIDDDSLYTGKVIYVDDGKSIIPYKIPELSLEDKKQLEVYRVQEKANITTHVTDYTSLSNYELGLLLRKKFNTSSVINNAKKEQKRREKKLSKERKK